MDDTAMGGSPGGNAAGRGDLERRLARVWAERGLTRRQLITVQRTVRHQARSGGAPTPEELWLTTARPLAERYATEARLVLDQEVPAWLLSVWPPGPDRAGGVLRPDVPGREAGAVLTRALADSTGLDQLGRWWQRRLRWAAIGHHLPALAVAPTRDLERLANRAELTVLDQVPWSHGDRLLTAYELALADLYQYGRHCVARALAAQAPACGRRPRRPVVVLP